MKRVLIGVALAVAGMTGLALTTCGGIALLFFQEADSQEMRSIASSGKAIMLVGFAILGAIAYATYRFVAGPPRRKREGHVTKD